jgi:hypothetical protein
MSKKMRKPSVRTLDAIDFANLASADPAVGKLNQNLSNPKCWRQLDLYHLERLLLLH